MGLVNMGINVKQWQRLDLACVARELSVMTLLAFSEGIAELQSGWCSPYQSRASFKVGSVCFGPCSDGQFAHWKDFVPLTPSLPRACAIRGMEKGIGENVTSFPVLLTHLEHENPKGWTTKSAEKSYFESVGVSLQMKFSTDQFRCNTRGRDCNPNFLYTKMEHELTFYSGKNHTTCIIQWKGKLCAKIWLVKDGTG